MEIDFLEKYTEPSKSTLEAMRMASVIKTNRVIELVRELRDSPLNPHDANEPAEIIAKILTELSALKGGLLFSRGDE